jgi:hypothetical protein
MPHDMWNLSNKIAGPWRMRRLRQPKRLPHVHHRARMEDVLDLYAEAPDPSRPVVCFDESPIQLVGEVRAPMPPRPGQLERYDCEYKRNGTANLFVFLDVHRPWRKVSRSPPAGLRSTSPPACATRRRALPQGRAHPRRPR